MLLVSLEANENKLPPEAAAALTSGSKFVLYSLEPALLDGDLFAPPQDKKEESKPKRERLDLFEILGQTELKDAADRKTAVAAILESMKAWDGAVTACFHPRHALRVIHQDSVFDFVICFECRTIKLFRDSNPLGHVNITGTPDKLDQILKRAVVPMPEPGPK